MNKGSILSVKTLGLCLALLAIVLGAIFLFGENDFFKVPIGSVFLLGIVLLCPLMHLWMMESGGHKH